jgi:uncharacterized protein YndB with AHSA1/START domain
LGEKYDFVDVWTVDAPLEIVWRMVDDVAAWPRWWPDYRLAEVVSEVKHGAGARWHVKVKADLPYTVDFHFDILVHEPPSYVRTRVEGFFEGEIDWSLVEDGPTRTRMTLHEQTETQWAFINLAARLGLRGFLERNHAAAMRRGEEGLRRILASGYEPPNLD